MKSLGQVLFELYAVQAAERRNALRAAAGVGPTDDVVVSTWAGLNDAQRELWEAVAQTFVRELDTAELG